MWKSVYMYSIIRFYTERILKLLCLHRGGKALAGWSSGESEKRLALRSIHVAAASRIDLDAIARRCD